MDLNQADIEELAAFFGRRLDPALARTPPPADAREERRRTAAWMLVLEEAADQGRLSALFARIRNKHPADAQLQRALELLLEPGSHGSSAIGAVLLAAAAAGFVLVAGAVTTGGVAAWYGLQPDAAVARAVQLGQVEIATVQTGPETLPTRAEHAPITGRCTRPDGGRVGYWYAGRQSPGMRGDQVTLTGAVNVRVDYPDAHNRFHTGAHIECVLQKGDIVELSSDPIPVPGGAWWVPLSTGDLVRTGT